MGRKICRVGAAIAVITFALTALPAGAASRRQEESGHVTAASGPPKVGPVYIGACGMADAMAGWSVNRGEAFESRFTVDRVTGGRRFTLTPSVQADLAITFFAGWSAVRTYDARSSKGETGRVPRRATGAAVCLVAGPATGFRYQAG